MGDEAQFGSIFESHGRTSRKLMRAIQTIGAGYARVSEVVSVGNEIYVAHRRGRSGKRVRNYCIHRSESGKVRAPLRRQFYLQAVINRPSDRKKHLVGSDEFVDSRECRCLIRVSA